MKGNMELWGNKAFKYYLKPRSAIVTLKSLLLECRLIIILSLQTIPVTTEYFGLVSVFDN